MTEFLSDSRGRLDAFLAKQADISRVRAGQLVKEGCVKVNGRVTTKPAHIVEPDDVVMASIEGLKASEDHVEPIDLKLEILYEDDECLVINKPAGVAVHPAIGIPKNEATILHGAAFLLKERKIPFVASHVLVHRLDRETTGCLLIAKNPDAHRKLQSQFANRTVAKSYLALVSGIPKNAAAMIDAPIGRSTIHRTKMSVHNTAKTREAKTSYRVLGSSNGVSLLQCDLHTGRTHQLRVHLTTIGHPILGDETYNNKESQKKSRELQIDDLCLHSWNLSFNSPTGKRVEVNAKMPVSYLEILTTLGMSGLH